MAENSIVWCFSLREVRILRRAWIHPISSTWSASSRTRCCLVRYMPPRYKISINRPGFGTSISVPLDKILNFFPKDAPSTTEFTLRFLIFVTAYRDTEIWFTNSHVEARIKVLTVLGAGLPGCESAALMIGKPQASVLSISVCATLRISFPLKAEGIACAWMGKGGLAYHADWRRKEWLEQQVLKILHQIVQSGSQKQWQAYV